MLLALIRQLGMGGSEASAPVLTRELSYPVRSPVRSPVFSPVRRPIPGTETE